MVTWGSGGAEVAPATGFATPQYEVGSFVRGPAEVCVPAAPLQENPLIRKEEVPANVAVVITQCRGTHA